MVVCKVECNDDCQSNRILEIEVTSSVGTALADMVGMLLGDSVTNILGGGLRTILGDSL